MSTAIEMLSEILNEKQPFPSTKKEKWNFIGDYFSLKFREFLSPDSEEYRCAINPTFSFEFEMSEEKFLNQVKVFSLRDGVMPLMRFFAINPVPQNFCSLLIVDSRLSSLVPEAWRSKVILRTAYIHEGRKQTKKVILFCSPDPMSLPLDILEKELDHLEKNLNPDDELFVLFSSLRLRGEGQAMSDKAWGYKIFLKMLRKFEKRKIEVLSYGDYLKMDVSFSRFHFINPLNFYFSDSFLFHDAAQRGASSLIAMPVPEQFSRLNLSLNHGFYFHQNFAPYRGEKHDKVQRTLFSSIETYAKTKQFLNINNKLYPKDFMDWGHDVALELYKDCHKNV